MRYTLPSYADSVPLKVLKKKCIELVFICKDSGHQFDYGVKDKTSMHFAR